MENRKTNEFDNIFEEMKDMMDSTALVTARMIDSIVNNSQLASSITPEMQDLFRAWMDCISGDIKKKMLKDGEISSMDIQKMATQIGINTNTMLSLVLYLHRKGEIRIEQIKVAPSEGINTETGCH